MKYKEIRAANQDVLGDNSDIIHHLGQKLRPPFLDQ